jgi:ribosomal silencing factor RsfS
LKSLKIDLYPVDVAQKSQKDKFMGLTDKCGLLDFVIVICGLSRKNVKAHGV